MILRVNHYLLLFNNRILTQITKSTEIVSYQNQVFKSYITEFASTLDTHYQPSYTLLLTELLENIINENKILKENELMVDEKIFNKMIKSQVFKTVFDNCSVDLLYIIDAKSYPRQKKNLPKIIFKKDVDETNRTLDSVFIDRLGGNDLVESDSGEEDHGIGSDVSYSDYDDEIEDILGKKKNRPGQRARREYHSYYLFGNNVLIMIVCGKKNTGIPPTMSNNRSKILNRVKRKRG